MTTFTEYASTAELDKQLALQIAQKLQQGLDSRGKASLVVSGGKTPCGLFHCLTQQNIGWDKVVITLADERWVDADNDASNEKLVREHLLQGYAAKAAFVGLKNGRATPFEGATEVGSVIKQQVPAPFDVLILGMGEDGHTASLFPRAENLQPGLDMQSGQTCVGMTPLTAPIDRITLTLPALLNSRQIYLHLVGQSKRNVYQQAQSGTDVTEMPVRAVLQQSQTPVEVVWAAQ